MCMCVCVVYGCVGPVWLVLVVEHATVLLRVLSQLNLPACTCNPDLQKKAEERLVAESQRLRAAVAQQRADARNAEVDRLSQVGLARSSPAVATHPLGMVSHPHGVRIGAEDGRLEGAGAYA